jgi:hypothetical protein
MPKLKRLWTSEDDARLRSLLEAGASVSLVAAKLKRTAGAAKSRSSQLGVAHRRAPPRAKSHYRI